MSGHWWDQASVWEQCIADKLEPRRSTDRTFKINSVDFLPMTCILHLARFIKGTGLGVCRYSAYNGRKQGRISFVGVLTRDAENRCCQT